MKPKQAIDILIRQRERLKNPEYSNDHIWVTQTASHVKDFFGLDSEQYRIISRFTFIVHSDTRIHSNEDIRRMHRERNEMAEAMINSFIETIQDKGLYTPPKSNFLQNKGNKEVSAYIILAITVIFWTGRLYERMEFIQSKATIDQENKALRDSIILLSIPPNKEPSVKYKTDSKSYKQRGK